MSIKRESTSVLVANKKKEWRVFCSCGFTAVVNHKNCTKCGKSVDVDLSEKYKHVLATLDKKETQKNIKFTFEKCEFKNPFLERSSDIDNVRFTFDKKIYMIRLDKNNGKIMIYHGTREVLLDGHEHLLRREFFGLMQYYPEMLREIIETFLNARDIKYLKPEIFMKEKFYKLGVFTVYPNLVLLDRMDISLPIFGEEIVKAIESSNTKTDMIKRLTGHKSKRIMEKIKTPSSFNFLMVWGKCVEKTEHILNFMEKINIVYNNEAFSSTYPELFYEGIELIKKLHQGKSDKIWLNRLLKSKIVRGFDHTLNNSSIEHFIADIARMYGQIIRENSNYEIKFNGELDELHDHLMLDLKKIRIKNNPIPYSDEEIKMKKVLDEEKEITLPKDTHTLVEIGSQMNICVGSYHEKALQKECTIFLLKENKVPTVCLEVFDNKLKQAKMKYNKIPTGEYRDEVITWCEEKNIDYSQCSDIA